MYPVALLAPNIIPAGVLKDGLDVLAIPASSSASVFAFDRGLSSPILAKSPRPDGVDIASKTIEEPTSDATDLSKPSSSVTVASKRPPDDLASTAKRARTSPLPPAASKSQPVQGIYGWRARRGPDRQVCQEFLVVLGNDPSRRIWIESTKPPLTMAIRLINRFLASTPPETADYECAEIMIADTKK